MTAATWTAFVVEPASLAWTSLRTERGRSVLAVAGVVVGIVTVVLVASILANARNQVALLFRDLGTENVFAFHLTGDPYTVPSEAEASRRPLDVALVREIERLGTTVRDVGAQVIVPVALPGRALVARAAGTESDAVLVEGTSPSLFDIIGAEFARGRPFTALEDREAARVTVLGSGLARVLFGPESAIGRRVTLAGENYTVVGVLQPRQGGFLGENRQDNVMHVPVGTARARFGEPNVWCCTSAPSQALARRVSARSSPSCGCSASCRQMLRTTSRSRPPTRSSRPLIRSARASALWPWAWLR